MDSGDGVQQYECAWCHTIMCLKIARKVIMIIIYYNKNKTNIY